jgi:thiol-disulfide isomerase/thioredoxin
VVRRALAALALCAAALLGSAHAGELVLRRADAPRLALRDRDGATRGLADLGGKLTLAHFWATWCGTCRTEFPALDALQGEMRGEGLRVAAIALDKLGWFAIDRLTKELGVREVALFHDLNREAATAFGVVGLPTTVVLDAKGREVGRIVGEGAWADPKLRAQLRALMGE